MNSFQMNITLLFVGLGAIVCLLVILWAIYIMMKIPRNQSGHSKLITIATWNLVLFALAIYTAFPLLSTEWALERSLQTANSFMSLLNKGDYITAQGLVEDMSAKGNEIRSSLENPVNRPISWDLKVTGYHPPSYVATGTVTLPDNREVPVNVYVNWVWETASWKISGVQYNPYFSTQNKNDIRFLSGGTDKSFIIKTATILVSVVSVFLSIKYLLALFRENSNQR